MMTPPHALGTGATALLLATILALAAPSPGHAKKDKNLDKAKQYCRDAGFDAKACSDCGEKNSAACKCCYKKKPFWCPKGLAKAPVSYGLYKCCIEGEKGEAVKRDLNKVRNAVATVNPLSITKAYDLYFAHVASGKTVDKQALRASVASRLQPHYRFDLKQARIAESNRTTKWKKGAWVAMTNCKTIWFPAGSDMVTKIQSETLDDGELEWFAHELQHVEQCFEKGGRRNYAKMWFGQVPTTWITLITNGKPGDVQGDGLHDAMPMEADADRKGSTVRRALGSP